MSISASPEKKIINVPVDRSMVIFHVKEVSFDELQKFLKERFPVKGRGRVKDNANEARIKFIDSILTEIECKDEDGNPEVITYKDPDSGEKRELNSSVDNWKRHVNPGWKISAAIPFEESSADMETADEKDTNTLKN